MKKLLLALLLMAASTQAVDYTVTSIGDEANFVSPKRYPGPHVASLPDGKQVAIISYRIGSTDSLGYFYFDGAVWQKIGPVKYNTTAAPGTLGGTSRMNITTKGDTNYIAVLPGSTGTRRIVKIMPSGWIYADTISDSTQHAVNIIPNWYGDTLVHGWDSATGQFQAVKAADLLTQTVAWTFGEKITGLGGMAHPYAVAIKRGCLLIADATSHATYHIGKDSISTTGELGLPVFEGIAGDRQANANFIANAPDGDSLFGIAEIGDSIRYVRGYLSGDVTALTYNKIDSAVLWSANVLAPTSTDDSVQSWPCLTRTENGDMWAVAVKYTDIGTNYEADIVGRKLPAGSTTWDAEVTLRENITTEKIIHLTLPTFTYGNYLWGIYRDRNIGYPEDAGNFTTIKSFTYQISTPATPGSQTIVRSGVIRSGVVR